ncbi:MAG: glycosyltransferase [Kiritimatiellae bacterium]|nr:glycosyltransferase [Kiritimatiellia bacterium]
MKVLHVISGLGDLFGGPSRSSQGLVAAECRAGVDARIYSFDGAAPWVEGVRRAECAVEGWDIVHIHGLWDYRLHKVAAACRKAGVPYVISPRGMLEPWSLGRKRLKKRLARFIYQDRDLRGAAALHATAGREAAEFRRLGFDNPAIVAPNGVNAPASLPPKTRREKKRALFLGRMHPGKGVPELVDAWLRSGITGWECELVYTASGEAELGYEAAVKEKVRELHLEGDFIFTGPLDDDAKWTAYRRADLFVLPTYSENFGIVVAEALYAGAPVVTTKGTPWRELETERCGWWIDLPPAESLCAALRAAAELPREALDEMGARGRKLVEARYTWDGVCRAMLAGYERVVGEISLLAERA